MKIKLVYLFIFIIRFWNLETKHNLLLFSFKITGELT